MHNANHSLGRDLFPTLGRKRDQNQIEQLYKTQDLNIYIQPSFSKTDFSWSWVFILS